MTDRGQRLRWGRHEGPSPAGARPGLERLGECRPDLGPRGGGRRGQADGLHERTQLGQVAVVGAERGPESESDLLDVWQHGVGDERCPAIRQGRIAQGRVEHSPGRPKETRQAVEGGETRRLEATGSGRRVTLGHARRIAGPRAVYTIPRRSGRRPRRCRLRYRPCMSPRRLTSASILAVGTELTTGTTRDTNSGDLARDLAALGVAIERLVALPDELAAVTEAIRDGLARADFVVVTGGLGPTPDDLTREAIAAACDERPEMDPVLETWLAALFARRGVTMAAINRKQAWLIPSASALENARGTAPGWWVERPDGRLVIALPGPPSEMRPMWRDHVLPRLRLRGVGADRASVTLRLTGIGESALADLIGEERLRRANPRMATYARVDAVDLRISAVGDGEARATDLVAKAEAAVAPLIAAYEFARGDETWIDALTVRLGHRRVAVVEIGTAGQVAALLAAAPWFTFGETLAAESALAQAHPDLQSFATRVRDVGSAEIGVAVRARERAGDTSVTVASDIDGRLAQVTHAVFLAGDQGRRRAALAVAAELWRRLGEDATSG